MRMSPKDMHTKKQHTFIGIGAMLLGVALGVGAVYLNGTHQTDLVIEAATTACPEGNYGCYVGQPPPEGQKGPCMKEFKCIATTPGGTCPGTCQKAGPGELTCKSIGSCDGKKLEGKPKEEPKEEGKGGEMPKLPELPKGGGGGGGQPPPTDPTQEECKKEPRPANCPNTGISGLLGNLFGTNTTTSSSTSNVVQTTFKSVADKLSSFLSGGESAPTVNTSVPSTPAPIANPTQAVVTPVTPSASNAANVAPQTNTGSTNSAQGAGSPANGQPAVTGFNSSASADVNTSTGPILSAIRSVTSRIQEILSSLF